MNNCVGQNGTDVFWMKLITSKTRRLYVQEHVLLFTQKLNGVYLVFHVIIIEQHIGTPIQNTLDDMYSLLCFLNYKPYADYAIWKFKILNSGIRLQCLC